MARSGPPDQAGVGASGKEKRLMSSHAAERFRTVLEHRKASDAETKLRGCAETGESVPPAVERLPGGAQPEAACLRLRHGTGRDCRGGYSVLNAPGQRASRLPGLFRRCPDRPVRAAPEGPATVASWFDQGCHFWPPRPRQLERPALGCAPVERPPLRRPETVALPGLGLGW